MDHKSGEGTAQSSIESQWRRNQNCAKKRPIPQFCGRTDGQIEQLARARDAEQTIQQLVDVLHDLELAGGLGLWKANKRCQNVSSVDMTARGRRVMLETIVRWMGFHVI